MLKITSKTHEYTINTAVAESLGWFINETCGGIWTPPRGKWVEWGAPDETLIPVIPHFSTSLDACARFEKKAPLFYWETLAAVQRLTSAVIARSETPDAESRMTGFSQAAVVRMLKAPPRERCRAWLLYCEYKALKTKLAPKNLI